MNVQFWIADDVTGRVKELLRAGEAVHRNAMYRWLEYDGDPKPEQLHAFMASAWKRIGEELRGEGLILAPGNDPVGEPVYMVVPEDPDVVPVPMYTSKLWG